MTGEPERVPIKLALERHEELIAQFGGEPGVRDPGRLEAALARPRQAFAYENPSPDLLSMGVMIFTGILQNHPFVDGNKRSAVDTLLIFLGLNGYTVEAEEQLLYLLAKSYLTDEYIDEPALCSILSLYLAQR